VQFKNADEEEMEGHLLAKLRSFIPRRLQKFLLSLVLILSLSLPPPISSKWKPI
jgi:hypothetical protein